MHITKINFQEYLQWNLSAIKYCQLFSFCAYVELTINTDGCSTLYIPTLFEIHAKARYLLSKVQVHEALIRTMTCCCTHYTEGRGKHEETAVYFNVETTSFEKWIICRGFYRTGIFWAECYLNKFNVQKSYDGPSKHGKHCRLVNWNKHGLIQRLRTSHRWTGFSHWSQSHENSKRKRCCPQSHF